MKKSVKRLNDLIREPYAWPVGYAKVAIMDDGACVCPKCLQEELDQVYRSTRDDHSDGWNVVDTALIVEVCDESPEHCAHCGRDLSEL